MSAYLTAANTMRTTRIITVKTESPTVKTFIVKDTLCSKAKPGQFLMLWAPRVDEIPLSILDAGDGAVSVAVKAVGEATRALHMLKSGDTVGVRGPFGTSFTENDGRILLAGGGTGTAPLLFLAKKLAAKVKRLIFVMGAKTKDELLFLREIEALCTGKSVVAATEDGSYGLKCLATEPLEALFAQEKFDMVYTCGPELMVRKVFELAEQHGVAVEASLERLMRCSIGICGSCVIGKYRVCRDGPVFNATRLREVTAELGVSKLGFDGARIPI
ncbi:MAG: dihydroorotate dehydrogenase electron transfer subunit [Candidatus Bathyarchaeota archaeon]|nr:dihydroorotate dehydrogenase electron transfer subunit [Candidatus Bathyarchaeota archaeon]